MFAHLHTCMHACGACQHNKVQLLQQMSSKSDDEGWGSALPSSMLFYVARLSRLNFALLAFAISSTNHCIMTALARSLKLAD